MFLKNTGARLVMLNTVKPKEGTYNIIPAGEAVEVPDAGINEHVKAYIDSLIASGELVEVAAPKAEKAGSKKAE